MGRGRNGVISQSKKVKKEKTAARKGEVTYCFHKQKQKEGETMQVSEDFIEELKK